MSRVIVHGFFGASGGESGGGGGEGPSVRLGGNQSGTATQATASIPLDNTIPQINEGAQFLAVSWAPASADSVILVQGLLNCTSPSGSMVVALFRHDQADALDAAFVSVAGSSVVMRVPVLAHVVAGTTDAITFSLRAGSGNAGGKVVVNGISDNALPIFGGALKSSILITEMVP